MTIQSPGQGVEERKFTDGDIAGQRIPTLAGIVTVAIAICIILTTLLMTIRAYLPVPIGDQWEELTTADHLSRLYSPHNEHVLLFPRMLFIIDKKYFGGSNIFNEAMTFFIQFLHAALLWILARRAKLPALLSAGIILSTLFWSYQYENFILGFQVQFVGVCAAATAALVTLGFKRERGVPWAIAVAFIAMLSMANGLLVGILLMFLAICLRLSWRYVGVLSGAAGAMIVIFLALHHTSGSPSGKAPTAFGTLIESIAHPGAVVSYVGVYLGAPFGRLLFRGDIRSETASRITAMIGLSGLLLLLVAGATVWRRIRSGQTQQASALVLIHIELFAVGSALLTAIGRSRAFPISQAFSGRYGAVALKRFGALVRTILMMNG